MTSTSLVTKEQGTFIQQQICTWMSSMCHCPISQGCSQYTLSGWPWIELKKITQFQLMHDFCFSWYSHLQGLKSFLPSLESEVTQWQAFLVYIHFLSSVLDVLLFVQYCSWVSLHRHCGWFLSFQASCCVFLFFTGVTLNCGHLIIGFLLFDP